MRNGRSRSAKVIDFGTNRKRVCDFLLVISSNHGPILLHFGDIAGFLLKTSPHPYSTSILGVPPLKFIVDVEAPRSKDPNTWNYFRSNPTNTPTVHQHYRRTDGQTDERPTIAIPRFALRPSRGNKTLIKAFLQHLHVKIVTTA